MNFDEIEKKLRTSPQPKPPAGLKQKLAAQIINLRTSRVTPVSATTHRDLSDWLRRWWPALAPATVSLACGVMMISQQIQARELRQVNQSLEQKIIEARAATTASVATAQSEATTANTSEQNEIARLRERADQLAAAVARLEKLQADNDALRKQPATSSGFSEDELAALTKAKEKAMSMACINNLKQVGLAARLWAQDSNDIFPPNFLSMSNELGSARILLCPADTNRIAAKTFTDYTDANCSYELLAPSGSDLETHRVLARCPVHGHLGLCDGSVQHGEVAKNHPDWLVERDGKLFLIPFGVQVKPRAPLSK